MANVWLYIATVLVWGSTWIALKYQAAAGPALHAILDRFIIAAAILMAIVLYKNRRLPKFHLKQHGFLSLQGLLMFCVNYICFFECIKYIITGLAAVAYTSIVIFNIILGHFIFKTRLTPQMIVGSALGITGIVLVFWHDLVMCETLNVETLYGFGYGMLGALCSSSGNMVSGYMQKQGVSVINNSAFGMVYGIFWTLVLCLLQGHPFEWVNLGRPDYLWSTLYLAVVGSAFAFWAYLKLLGALGPGNAAYMFILTPIIALILSTFFEGYEWTLTAFMGIGLAIMGNVLVLWKRR